MKVWILRPVEGLPSGDDPWDPWYDKAFGFIVRAETEEEARGFAHEDAGDENRGEFAGGKISETTTPWLDSKYTTCIPLSDQGEIGVVMRDFSAA